MVSTPGLYHSYVHVSLAVIECTHVWQGLTDASPAVRVQTESRLTGAGETSLGVGAGVITVVCVCHTLVHI